MATVKQFSTKSMAEVTKKLYLNEETADVHFAFEIDGDEQRVAAHKNILALGSPVFYAMFYGPLKEKGDVKIRDASMNGFMDFLTIFYMEEVKITTNNVAEFIDLANKYDMPEGMKICEEFLLENTKVVDLCKHYALAVKFNLNNLLKKCECGIRENATEVFKSNDFINISKKVLELILKLDNYNCFEADIFNACVAWAKNACEENETDATEKQSLRQSLGECFYLIPFTTMKIAAFSKVVFANKTLFTLDEVADIMALIMTGESTEVSTKFMKNRDAVEVFNWDDEYIIECDRDGNQEYEEESDKEERKRLDEEGKGTLISRDEYTTFTASEKMLFGGFRFVDFKNVTNVTNAGNDLSATIKITKQIDNVYELMEKIQLCVYADKKTTKPIDIKLEKPIIITPRVKYNIHVDFSNNATTKDLVDGFEYVREYISPYPQIVDEDIFIEFHTHPESEYGTDYSIISQLYFNRL
ncbi:BTB/POZ domain-containing protein 3-like [Contarinia nasturtii]|uniref:BTB/POZ domain-containing protein 3-like n=1 Tax=Contarinia nasturtii TaxID=265458 RepID=UPI0012D3ED8D|nr:BTB/POZ domain-containing protein 3-like [Contarinia nasturtii]